MKIDEEIKKFLKEHLTIKVENKKIQLVLDNEVFSETDISLEEKNKSDELTTSTLVCEACNQIFEESSFCYNCSEPERAICLNCCSCIL